MNREFALCKDAAADGFASGPWKDFCFFTEWTKGAALLKFVSPGSPVHLLVRDTEFNLTAP